MSEMSRVTQMTTGVIHFVSEMPRVTQMTTGVIHFMSEMPRVTQMTTGVIHFMSEMPRVTQMTTGVIRVMSECPDNNFGHSHHVSNAQGHHMTHGIIPQMTVGVIFFGQKCLGAPT